MNSQHTKTVIFFRSCYDTYNSITDEKTRLEYNDSVLRYGFDEEIKSTNSIVLKLLEEIKPKIDASKIRYANKLLKVDKRNHNK